MQSNRGVSSNLAQTALPHEILAEIFCQCLNRGENDTVDIRRDDHIEITLSSICRGWRIAAHDTTILWSKIDLNAPVPLVRLYLHLSGTCALQVSFEPNDADHDYIRLQANAQRAGHEAGRWESLCVVTNNMKSFDHLAFQLSVNAFPRLHRIKFAFTGQDNVFGIGPVFGEGAPNLRDVILRGLNPTPLRLPLLNVTTLCLSLGQHIPYADPMSDVMDTVQFREMLAALSSLETLILKNITVDFSSDLEDPILIPTLRSLTILMGVNRDEDYPVGVCMFLETPNLEALHLLGLEDDELEYVLQHYSWSDTSLPAFPCLRQLDIRHLDGAEALINIQRLARFLALTPSIRHLVLHQEQIEELLDELDQNESEPFPPLDTISFHCDEHEVRGGCIDITPVQNMIDRYLLNGSLKKLRFLRRCLDEQPELWGLSFPGGSIEEIPRGEWKLLASAKDEPFF